MVGGRGEGDRRGHGPRDRVRADRRQPGVARTAPVSAPARARPAGADPARRRHRADRLHDRHRLRCAGIRSARTSWPVSRRRSRRSPRSRPVLLAVILGLGAYRLLKRGVLVRRLNAEETLGAVDLIVTDKTGTITQNRLEVSSVRTSDGPVEDPGRCVGAPRGRASGRGGRLAGRGRRAASFTRALRAAIVDAGRSARELDAGEPGRSACRRIDALPVTRTRARRGRARRGAGPRGARGRPRVRRRSIRRAMRARAVDDLIEASAAAGERLVALAGRMRRRAVADARPRRLRRPDPARHREAMATARGAGIQVVVVTGDHPGPPRRSPARQASTRPIVTGDDARGLGRRSARRGARRPARRRPLDAGAEAAARRGRARRPPDRRRHRATA